MLSIDIDYNSQDSTKGYSGRIKDVAGVNGAPISVMPGFPDLEDQFNQMGITHFRLNDIYGVGDLDNGAVSGPYDNDDPMILNVPPQDAYRARDLLNKISNFRTIYPNAAIGMSQGNYDLAFKDDNYQITDDYIRRIMVNNPAVNPQGIRREVMFRVGRSKGCGAEIPAHFDIYVSLVATLVQRYSSELFLSGLPRKIAYWETWNEPDLSDSWNNNDPGRYYDFYSKIAWKIKEIDPNAKVGGAGIADGSDSSGAYINGFLSFCRSNNVPLDFISWHYYGNQTADPQNIIDVASNIQSSLWQNGYNDVESICSAWNSTSYASVDAFSKVQSAQNASYIAASLIHMQSCKVDRDYYYRGDALSFGLFNDDDNPVDTRYKSFSSYAAQAFTLFNQLRQAPTLLSTSNTDNTGISILAGKAYGTVKILVANYRVDPSLSDPGAPPASGRRYAQHYVDFGRDIAQMTDDWTVQNYFGGKNPTTLYNNNTSNQQTLGSSLFYGGNLTPRYRNYADSAGGVSLSVNNLSGNVQSVEARRIVEGGSLDAMLAPTTSSQVSFNMNGSTCTINDPGATESTVTLYTLSLSETSDYPPDSDNSNGYGDPDDSNSDGPAEFRTSHRSSTSAIGYTQLLIDDMMPRSRKMDVYFRNDKTYRVTVTTLKSHFTGCKMLSFETVYKADLISNFEPGDTQITLSLKFSFNGTWGDFVSNSPYQPNFFVELVSGEDFDTVMRIEPLDY